MNEITRQTLPAMAEFLNLQFRALSIRAWFIWNAKVSDTYFSWIPSGSINWGSINWGQLIGVN